MARYPRVEVSGVPLHIVQRGNNRSTCFFGDLDRRLYLKCLALAAAGRGCDIHAYVLMGNHVHLLVTPNAPGAASAMLQDVGRRYVCIVNKAQGRTGTLWEGRFKSSLIDSERYLFTCHRYIELNPVRAGMVRDPGEYPWSSHRFYASGAPDKVVTPHRQYLALGNSGPERAMAFRRLFGDTMEQTDLERLRISLNKGWALGSQSFLEEMGQRLGRPVQPPKRGRPKKVDERADSASRDQREMLF